jgi:hypothetical protein
MDGNIALTGEIDLSHGLEFIVAVAFGRSAQSASTNCCKPWPRLSPNSARSMSANGSAPVPKMI